jgi:hypothetical protein
MGIGELFWIIFVLIVIFGIYWNSSGHGAGQWGWYGNFLPWAVLIFLLGWKVFGFVIHA